MFHPKGGKMIFIETAEPRDPFLNVLPTIDQGHGWKTDEITVSGKAPGTARLAEAP
jgi:hypothetical protein